MSVGTIRIVGFTAGAERPRGQTSGCQAADFRMRLMQGKPKQLVRAFCNDPLYFALSDQRCQCLDSAQPLHPRLAYRTSLRGAAPVWRARRQPDYLRHIPERFGFYRTRLNNPVIWLHAVSVGETRACARCSTPCSTPTPTTGCLTHMTPTGRATAAELYGHLAPRAERLPALRHPVGDLGLPAALPPAHRHPDGNRAVAQPGARLPPHRHPAGDGQRPPVGPLGEGYSASAASPARPSPTCRPSARRPRPTASA
jgi:hypothetical protein